MSKNPISLLQEISVGRFSSYPKYEFEEIAVQEFKCKVCLCDFSREASARSKKAAKTLAAEGMLQELGVPIEAAAPECKIAKIDYSTINNLVGPTSLHNLPQLFQTTQLHSDSSNGITKCSSSSPDSPSASISPLRIHSLADNSQFPNHSISSNQKHDSTINLPSSSRLRSESSCSSDYQSCDEKDGNSPDDDCKRNLASSEFGASTSNGVSEKRKLISPSENVSNPVSFLHSKLSEMNVVPEYEEVNVINFGTDRPTYYFEVKVLDDSAIGSGSSKREAKANAALSLMPLLGIEFVHKEESDSKDNAVGQLSTFCKKNLIKTEPTYCCVNSEGDPHCKVFTIRCQVGTISVDRSAKTKKAAKNLSAKAVLEALQKDSSKLKSEKLTFESKLDNKDINLRAWKRLDESGARNRLLLNSTFDKLPLKDYLFMFENDFYGRSETLTQLKSDSKLHLHTLSNPGNVFREIVKELSIEYELTSLDSKEGFLLNLSLRCNPNWSFMETGSSIEEAKRKIFVTALEFMCTM